jgi:hypothetical protein
MSLRLHLIGKRAGQLALKVNLQALLSDGMFETLMRETLL